MKTLFAIICLPFVLMFSAPFMGSKLEPFVGVAGFLALALIPIYLYRKPLLRLLKSM